jgi:hypothetical protein
MERRDIDHGADMLVAYSKPRACAKPLTALAVGVGVVLAVSLAPGSARAQSAECQGMMKLLQDRVSLLQQWQTMQKKKQVSPAGACNLFTQLSSKVSAAIVEVEKNGTWCHVPEQVLPGLKDEQPKVSKARGEACKAVAMQKKMQAQQQQRAQQQRSNQGPLGGGDSVVGGPIKMPQGAL